MLRVVETIAQIAALSFAACLFVLTFLYASPRAAPDSPQQEYSEKNEPKKNNRETDKTIWEKARTDPLSYFTLWLVVFTAVLSGVGVIQLKLLMRAETVAEKSANAATKTANVAERTLTGLERPYIFLDAPKIMSLPSQLPVIIPQIEYTFRNYGRTPAIVHWIVAEANIAPGIPAKTTLPVSPKWKEFFNGRFVLKTGEDKTITMRGATMPLPRVPTGASPCVAATMLIVEVTYDDVFDYTHVNEFAFFLMPDSNGKGEGTVVQISGAENNRHKSKKFSSDEKWTPAWSHTWPPN